MKKPIVDDGWQRRPSEVDAEREFRIVRAPNKGQLELVIFSYDMIGRLTHFYDGRTRPCTGEGCSGCGRGIRREWHGYVACVQERLLRKVILEVTAGPGRQLSSCFDRYRTLRGLDILVGRKDGRPNGEVWLKKHSELRTDASLPPNVDLRPILLRMWQVSERVAPIAAPIVKPRIARTGTDDVSGREVTLD